MRVIGSNLVPIVQKLERYGECHIPFLELDTETHFIIQLGSLPGVSCHTDVENKTIHLMGRPTGEGAAWCYINERP